MFADGNAFEHEFARLGVRANQAEVGGPAADVTDENEGAFAERRHRPAWVGGDPRVERRERLLEQCDRPESRVRRRLDRQFARFFIERCGDGQDD